MYVEGSMILFFSEVTIDFYGKDKANKSWAIEASRFFAKGVEFRHSRTRRKMENIVF